MSQKSWVWQYACRLGDKAICNLCEVNLSCSGGSTGSVARHLEKIHAITPLWKRGETNETQDFVGNEPEASTSTGVSTPNPKRKKTQKSQSLDRPCNQERTELIHRALAKMVGVNQLPISFCASLGFQEFMSVVEPNYKACHEEALLKRFRFHYNSAVEKLKQELYNSSFVSCTSDCWTSCAQDAYITIKAHYFINEQWEPRQFVPSTHDLAECHTAINIADHLQDTFNFWQIDGKVTAVVTDNAINAVNAVQYLDIVETRNVTCAAHIIQLTAGKVVSEVGVEEILQKARAQVGHFKRSNVAKKALEDKQVQLELKKETLLQSSKTRWNLSYAMLDRLLKNRIPVTNVLADRTVTTAGTARRLELVESDWASIEKLVTLLKPLQALTTIFCSQKQSPISIVRPLLFTTVKEHYQDNEDEDDFCKNVTNFIKADLVSRFQLDWGTLVTTISARHIAPFLDPRYKDLEHENNIDRERIRAHVREMLTSAYDNNGDENRESVNTNPVATRDHLSALEFIFQEDTRSEDHPTVELEKYLAEPQMRFDLNRFEWWKSRERRYPHLAKLARQYLCIPATSASAERCFSTAGNIITAKRSCLLPENADILIFLFQNKQLL